MWRSISLIAITACGFHPGNATDARAVDAIDGPPIDSMPLDGMADCYGPASVQICFAQPPSTPNNIVAMTSIDTSTSPACDSTFSSPSGTDACVIAGSTISISDALKAYGLRPLIVVSPGDITITISGTIDVSSTRSVFGAGADSTACVAGSPALAMLGGSGGGGPGGSFGGTGGDGMGGGNGGAGGSASAATGTPDVLRSGCPGLGGAGTGPGAGAHGGGAVMLISHGTIHINGAVNASGGGGAGAGDGSQSGGGGGGSGGMIWLDAVAVTVGGTGHVFANGGGGGEGGSSATGYVGNPGVESAAPDVAGGGGMGGTMFGGNGGAGSFGAMLAGAPGLVGTSGTVGLTTYYGGGGAGGGGAGVIVIDGFTSGTSVANVAPPPS